MMFLGLRKLGNVCCGHKMFLNKIRNIFGVPDTKSVSATKVACAGKRGNICVGNNVSATMCPRLPGPLGPVHTYRDIFESATFSFGLTIFPVHTLSYSLRIYRWRADLKRSGFTWCVWMEAVSRWKNCRGIQKYPETCGRGLRPSSDAVLHMSRIKCK